MEKLQIVIILFSSLLGRNLVFGYPSGPPDSACTAMFPSGHGVAAQSSASPYSISASANTYSPGEQISVTVTSPSDNIKGFILEARRSDPSLNNDELIGMFTSAAANTKNNVCPNNGALTHSAPLSTTNLTATWTAPSTAQGHIVFVATVVKLKTEFWQNIQSSVVSDLSLVLPTHVNSTDSSILVWKQVNTTGVEKYTSEYKVKGSSNAATVGPEVEASAVNNGMLHLELTGLQSGTVYTITINEVFVTGSTVTDLPVVDYIYATVPEKPNSVSAAGLQSDGFTLQITPSNDQVKCQIFFNGILADRDSCGDVQITKANPGSSYTFQVFSVIAFTYNGSETNLTSLSAESLTVIIPPLPPASVLVTAVDTAQLNVTWTANASNGSTQSGFKIMYKKGLDAAKVASGCDNIAADKTSCIFSPENSTPGTSYEIYVYSVQQNTQSLTSTNTTGHTEPSPPVSFTTKSVTETSIAVQWSAPTGGGDYDSYVVTRTNGTDAPDTKSVAKAESADAEFTGLTAGTAYSFSVMTVYEGLNSEVVSHIENAKPAQPGTISLNEGSVTANSFGITWTDSTGVVDSYEVTINPEHGSKTVTGLEASFTGLTSGTTYTVTVVAVSGSQNSTATTKELSTKPLPPESVVTHAVTETSITVQWSASTGGGDYDNYVVTRTNGTGAPETKNVSKSASAQVEFTDLTSGEAYEFSVMTIYKSLQSSVVTHVDNTKPKPPSSLRIENPENDLKSDLITVTWTSPLLSGGETYDGYVIKKDSNEQTTNEVNIIRGAAKLTATFSVKSPGKLYTFTAATIVSTETGSQTSDTVTLNQRSRPLKPENITTTSVTTTEVGLTWTRPSSGEYSGYQLSINPKPEGAGVVDVEDKNQLTRTISSLVPGTKYTVSIKSKSDTVLSIGSVSVIFRCKPLTPTGLQVVENARTTTEIKVTWTGVQSGLFDGYIVRLEETDGGGNKMSETKSHTEATEHTFTGLYPGRQYSISIVSTMEGIESSPEIINLYTKPNPPTSISIGKDQTWIEVTWVIATGSDFIDQGAAYFISSGSPSYQNVGIGATKKNFTSLIPGETYTINIVTIAAESVISDPLTTTVTTIPSRLASLETTNIGKETIEVKWVDPENVVFDEYKLSIKEQSQSSPLKTENVAKGRVISKMYTFDGLTAGKQYEISVKLVSNSEEGPEKIISATTLPASVAALNKGEVTSRSIEVSWTEPENTQLDTYELLIDPNDGVETLPISINKSATLNYKFTDLSPGSRYNISIRTVSNDKKGSTQSIEVTTKPFPVTSSELETVNTTAIKVVWSGNSASKQDSFKVTYKEIASGDLQEATVQGANAAEFIINGLSPGQTYEIKVFAVSEGVVSDAVTKSQTTYPAKVVDLSTDVKGSSAITVTWQKGAVGKAVSNDELYMVKYRDIARESDKPLTIKNVTVGVTTDLDNLYPGEKYEITVVAVTSNMESAVATIFAVTYPLPPVNVTVVPGTTNTTSVTIQWAPAATHSVQYKIVYKSTSSIDTPQEMTKMIDVPQSQITLSELMSGHNYSVDIFTITVDNVISKDSPVEPERKVNKAVTVEPICDTNLTEDEARTSNTQIVFDFTENSGVFDYYQFCLDPDCMQKQEKKRDVQGGTVKFTKVSAGKEYNITVYTVSGEVFSQPKSIKIRTNPNPVQGPVEMEVTTTSVKLSWNKPDGEVFGYIVDCPDCPQNPQMPQNPTQEFTNLQSFKSYTFTITVKSGVDDSMKLSTPYSGTFNTSVGRPSAPREFREVDVKPYMVSFTWKKPEMQNGVIMGYNITYFGTKNGKEDHINEYGNNFKGDALQGNVSDLKAGFRYSFHIAAYTSAGLGEKATKMIVLPIEAPVLRLSPEQAKPKPINTTNRNQTTYFVTFVNAFSEQNGEITEYSVIVIPVSNDKATPVLKAPDKIDNWAKAQQTKEQYVTCKGKCGLFGKTSNRKKRAASDANAGFLVGNENCNVETHKNEICNGPLQPGMQYKFALRAHTENGKYTDTPLSAAVQTAPSPEETNATSIIVGVVVSIVLVGIILGVVYYLRRRGTICKEESDIDSNVSTNGSSVKMDPIRRMSSRRRNTTSRPVKRDKFPDHVRFMSKDSDFRYSEEYEDLKQVGREQPQVAAELPENRGKNRFTNILPYDHSRVKLLPTDDDEGTDYINANYMPGFISKREFIVTQGPLPSTVDDFWRMIWEQNCRAIVMLTKCVEKGREKCHQYWPHDSDPSFYGDLQVAILNETRTPDWNMTEFRMSVGEHTRNIRHFHYTAWPDFGVPAKPHSLIRFVRMVRSKIPREGGPVAVHCSAGVGRSGTFIVLDRLFQLLDSGNDVIDIYGIVHEMRKYRVWMVQTEQQYICIHQCIQCVLEGKEQEDIDMSPGVDNPAFEVIHHVDTDSCDTKSDNDEGINIEVN